MDFCNERINILGGTGNTRNEKESNSSKHRMQKKCPLEKKQMKALALPI